MAAASRSLVTELAGETLDWMAVDSSREDVADEVWAYALATYVDGTAVTPRGYDVTDTLTSDTCAWCFGELGDVPEGSSLCRDCFFGPKDGPADEFVPLSRRLIRFLVGGDA